MLLNNAYFRQTKPRNARRNTERSPQSREGRVSDRWCEWLESITLHKPALEAYKSGWDHFGAGEATSFWNRESFRSVLNIGSSRSSAGVSGTLSGRGPA